MFLANMAWVWNVQMSLNMPPHVLLGCDQITLPQVLHMYRWLSLIFIFIFHWVTQGVQLWISQTLRRGKGFLIFKKFLKLDDWLCGLWEMVLFCNVFHRNYTGDLILWHGFLHDLVTHYALMNHPMNWVLPSHNQTLHRVQHAIWKNSMLIYVPVYPSK